MAIQGPIDLKEIVDAQVLKQLLQQVNESHSTQLSLENINDLKPELQELLFAELENIPTLTNIAVKEEQFQQRVHDLENRNTLLGLYGIEKIPSTNYWDALVQAHLYSNIDTSGRYCVFQKMETGKKTHTQNELMGELGATWHRHLLSYLQSNKENFESIGFPCRQFTSGMLNEIPYNAASQLKAFNEHLSLDDPYMPFKQVTIEHMKLEDEGVDVLKTQVLQLIENNTRQGSPIDRLTISLYGEKRFDNEKALREVNTIIDAVLDMVNKRDKNTDFTPIRIQLYFSGVKLDNEYSKNSKKFKILLRKIREHIKKPSEKTMDTSKRKMHRERRFLKRLR